MNKTDIVEIMSKKTTQVAVLSVVIVGMMVVLVPMLIEEADARINGIAIASQPGTFSDVRGQMLTGFFLKRPTIENNGAQVSWITSGGGFGSESGSVFGRAGGEFVVFGFSNPARGDNRCFHDTESTKVVITCSITQGNNADATYRVSFIGQENNNKYCDLLSKFGGIDQSKLIKEKLHC
jgi:hypothetical protein